ncbi:hypothetical protein DPV82_04170 [Haemophilus haemolyticus]|nr:hypothetical protein DPV82_04170 [Haemophilus haemolyticus]
MKNRKVFVKRCRNNGKFTGERAPIIKRRASKAIFGIDYDCPKCVSFSLKNRANVTLESGVRQVLILIKKGKIALIISLYID